MTVLGTTASRFLDPRRVALIVKKKEVGDFGVILTANVLPSEQILRAVSKSPRISELWAMHEFNNPVKTLELPNPEYADQSHASQMPKDAKILQNEQCACNKMVIGLSLSEHRDVFLPLGRFTVKGRRARADLIKKLKELNGC